MVLRHPSILSQLFCIFSSLFVQAEHDSATSTWTELLKHQMECSSHRLEDCKLTADDVPVIVDK